MPLEIIAAALGILGKAMAEPVKNAAMRRTAVVSTLKRLHLDPKQPPRDFESLYAYTLVEQLYGKPAPLLALFRDEYVQQAFAQSFTDDDWSRLHRETDLAIERNRESEEFGRLGHDFNAEQDAFIEKFQELVSRSRAAYETRLEKKVDNVKEMLDQVLKTRDVEEAHRIAEDPGRAEVSPAERLKNDVSAWFNAVGYQVDRSWKPGEDNAALLVHVPKRRRGQFDRVVVLCVEGELAPHQLDLLDRLVEEEEAAEGWGVAQLRVSEAARRRSELSSDKLSCFSFDELIEMEADFEPYIDWLQEEVRRRNIHTRYVPLSCRKEEVDPVTEAPLDTSNYNWRQGGLDNYVETWLTDPAKKHLSLLGEFGMGKSWFALHFANKMAQAWKDAKSRGVPRPRIPLVIPLRDYAKQTSVSALLSEFFFNKHKIGLRNYDVFSVLNRMGRLLLIFDGFDEMASRIDRNTMVANFWELAKAVEPGAKVLLSSRTEHFPEAKEARDLFGARVSTAASVVPSDGPTFEIVELVPFDDTQIRQMLGHLLTRDKVKIVMEHEDVRDLMRRPVMSELVIDALPEIERGAAIDLARIYLYAIRRKMDRDVTSKRTFTSRADKLFFLSEVAWEMLRSNQLTLNYRDFPDKLRACFGSVVESRKDLDYWEQDMRNQGMLVRNAEGDYGPSHKSLLEFLTAYKFAAELGLVSGDFLHLIPGAEEATGHAYSWSEYFASRRPDGSLPGLEEFKPETVERLVENFGAADFIPVVYDFLSAIIREHPGFEEALVSHIQSTASVGDARALGGNCANLLGQARGTLASANLEGADLTGFRLVINSQPNMSLVGANLRNSQLTHVDLSELDLMGADFTGASMNGNRHLSSNTRVEYVVTHPSGAISALLTSQNSSRRYAALHWPNGDIASSPTEIELSDLEGDSSWWRRSSVFEWEEADCWGYSDGITSVIRSSRTEEVLMRVTGSAATCIQWDGSPVLVMQGREPNNSFQWRIVDPRSDEELFVTKGLDLAQARSFSYYSDDSSLNVWAKEEERSRIFQLAPGMTTWNEVAQFPVGLKDSISELDHNSSILANDQHVYISDLRQKPLVFQREFVEPSMLELKSTNSLIFTPDRSMIALSAGRSVSVWRTGPGVWEQLWTTSISTRAALLASSRDGSVLIINCYSGEIFTRSFASGNLLSERSYNPHLAGARFSGDCGLDVAQLASIQLAGGIVEETD